MRLAWRLGALMAFSDLVALVTAFALAIGLAAATRDLFGLATIGSATFFSQRAVELTVLAMLALGVFAFGGLYRRGAWEMEEIKKIVAGVALVALFDATLQYVARDHDSRLWFAFAYPLAAVLIIAFRMMLRGLPRVKEALTSHVVLIGEAVTSDLLINELRENRSGPVRLLASLRFDEIAGEGVAPLDDRLSRIIAQSGVPAAKTLTILAPNAEELPNAQAAIERLNAARRPYSIVLPFHGLARTGLRMQEVIGADMVLAEMTPIGDPGPVLWLKRALDLVAAMMGLILLAPFFAVLAVMLKLEGGDVFFRQSRVGRGGARFDCLKFRTMRPGAEALLAELLANNPNARAEWDAHQKLSDDPRVTKLGDFLRRTSIDELPQLINVLKGEMSLVGPRPIVAPEVDGYPSDRAYFRSRAFAYYARCTPGITGLWQVSGRASTRHEERVRLDRWYCRNWSFWLDLIVLFKTVGAVLGRKGSH